MEERPRDVRQGFQALREAFFFAVRSSASSTMARIHLRLTRVASTSARGWEAHRPVRPNHPGSVRMSGRNHQPCLRLERKDAALGRPRT